jgi:protein-disulfide isomerase
MYGIKKSNIEHCSRVFSGHSGSGKFCSCTGFSINIATAPLAVTLKDVGKLTARADGLAASIETLKSEIKGLKEELAAKPQQPQPQQPQPQQPPAEDLSKVYDIPVGTSYVLGNPNAKITIVEFSDFQCPFCARFHPFILEARKAFPNDVKVVLKNFPLGFHPNARPAAKAALAAGLQGKYYEMAELLIASGNDLSEAKYKEIAGKVGINVDQFMKDLKDKDAEFEKKIEADIALGGQVDVRGTPTYFLNGKKTNARTTEMWTSEIKALLQQ